MKSEREKAKLSLRGATFGTTTPFLKEGGLDEEGFCSNLEFYIKSGIKSFVIGGFTGEVTALTSEERKRLYQLAVEQSAGRATIIVDTHHPTSLNEAIALARYAEEAGADFAYMMVPQYYWKTRDEALLDFFKKIAKQVKIGIVIYANSYRTGIHVKPSLMKGLLQYENIVGIKIAEADIVEVTEMIAAVGDEIVVSVGWDAHAVHGEIYGAPYYFGMVGNFDPKLELKFEQAVINLDRKKLRQILFSFTPLRKFYGEVDAPVVLKAAQEMVGLVGGPARFPLIPMTKQQRMRLRKILEDLGTRVIRG